MRKISLALVSLVALSSLVATTALGLDREVVRWMAPEEALVPVPASEIATASPRAILVDLDVSEEAIQAELEPAIEAVGVELPDLGRERADRAIRQMEELGLELRVTGDWGERVDRRDGRQYRIRPDSLSHEPGSKLEEGTVVSARAYALAFADGY